MDLDTFNISEESLIAQIENVMKEGKLRPRAIVAVDLFGLPADFTALKKIADKYGLLLLEDGAQGFGGSIDGKKACSFGDISTTSFFPAKPLGCYGDGGAVFTDDDETAQLLESIRIHGKGDGKYDNVRIGLNSRLDTIQAAILSIKLKAFRDYELQDINQAAQLYTEKLKDIVKTPIIPDGFYSSWAQYTIQLENRETRNKIQQDLKAKDIPSMIYYQKPMHKQGAFGGQAGSDELFPNTIKLCDTVLSLPIHPYITEEDIALVASVIKENL